MATSTFYDNIVIEKEAGEILAELLKQPAPPRRESKIPFDFTEMSEEKLKQLLENSKKLQKPQTAK